MSENKKEVEVVVRLGSIRAIIEVWRDRDEKGILVVPYISAYAKTVEGSVKYVELTTIPHLTIKIERGKELDTGEIVKNIVLRVGVPE